MTKKSCTTSVHLSLPAQPRVGTLPRPLTFFPEGGSRDVGEWEMGPPKAVRTVVLGVVLALKVP